MDNWYAELHTDIAEELQKEKPSFEEIFLKSATNLMKKYILVINSVHYELVELEYYFFHLKHHRDPYVHKHCLQLASNQFYVHERNFPRAGVDITFGTEEYFGGILIRGLKKGDMYTTGPSNCLKLIINDTKLSIDDDWKSFQEELQFKLEKGGISEASIYKGSRCLPTNSPFCDKNELLFNQRYRFARKDYLDSAKEKITGTIRNKTSLEEASM